MNVCWVQWVRDQRKNGSGYERSEQRITVQEIEELTEALGRKKKLLEVEKSKYSAWLERLQQIEATLASE